MRKDWINKILLYATTISVVVFLAMSAFMIAIPDKTWNDYFKIVNSANAQTSFPSNATTCDQTQTQRVVSGATSGTAAVQVIALATGTTVRVCSLTVVGTSGTTPTFSLVTGTGANCAGSQATLIPAFTTTAATPVVWDGPLVTVAPASTAICYLDTGTSPVQFYIIKYAQG